jgi:hypothetical protein
MAADQFTVENAIRNVHQQEDSKSSQQL